MQHLLLYKIAPFFCFRLQSWVFNHYKSIRKMVSDFVRTHHAFKWIIIFFSQLKYEDSYLNNSFSFGWSKKLLPVLLHKLRISVDRIHSILVRAVILSVDIDDIFINFLFNQHFDSLVGVCMLCGLLLVLR